MVKDASPNDATESRITTIQEAMVRAATLAIDVLEKTLDDALRIVDDIGLTTKAPTMANFDYWRNITAAQGNALCPCRSGKKTKHCLHRWTDPVPSVVSIFESTSRSSAKMRPSSQASAAGFTPLF